MSRRGMATQLLQNQRSLCLGVGKHGVRYINLNYQTEVRVRVGHQIYLGLVEASFLLEEFQDHLAMKLLHMGLEGFCHSISVRHVIFKDFDRPSMAPTLHNQFPHSRMKQYLLQGIGSGIPI